MTVTVNCPIIAGESALNDCLEVHKLVTQGRGELLAEDRKLCGICMLSWNCPVRHLVKQKGKWQKPEDRPKSDRVVDMPKEIVREALTFKLPQAPDYRRVGLSGRDMIYDDHLRTLQQQALGDRRLASDPGVDVKPVQRAGQKVRSKPQQTQVKFDVPDYANAVGADMSKVLQGAIKEEMRAASVSTSQSGSKESVSADTHKERLASVARADSVSGAKPQMTLKQRALAMKQRRANQ